MNWERTIFGVVFYIDTTNRWDGPIRLVWSIDVGIGSFRWSLARTEP